MERLTINKDVSEMSMMELAHNSCYTKDHCARYRDYDTDIDARELTIKLLEKHTDIPNEFTCDEDFDDFMSDSLQYGTDNILGLIAVFYKNIWAMANLRERLKKYEDLEEQGLLVKLPCKVGDTVFADSGVFGILQYEVDCIIFDKTITFQCSSYSESIGDPSGECLDEIEVGIQKFGKTVFLTRAEAEEAMEFEDGISDEEISECFEEWK